MIFYKDKDYVKAIIVKCDCHTHQIEVSKFKDEDCYYLTIYKEPKNIKYKLKQIFRILFKNYDLIEEVILREEDFKELIDKLKEVAKWQ